MWLMIASSISSPPTRSDCETTMPPREITATSVVPPPMSTTMFPVGSLTGRPAPIAAAIGSATLYTTRATRRVHRLLDNVHPPGARLVPGFLDRALLHPGDAAGLRHDDPGLGQVPAPVHLLDEIAQHALGHVEIGDDAVFERPHGHDVAWR